MSTLTSLPQPGDIGSVVATELRVLLARYGRTQRDLARELGISQSQMSKRMNGTVPMDIYELDKLASYFGVPVAALVGGTVRPGGGPGGGPGGIEGEERPRRDSNAQPTDYRHLHVIGATAA